jgi:hypothetical protein
MSIQKAADGRRFLVTIYHGNNILGRLIQIISMSHAACLTGRGKNLPLKISNSAIV